MRRSKKVALNVTTSFLQQAVAIICGLITPRLLLRAFGSEYNGVISSATQMLSMVSFLALGLAGAIRAELYPALANNDRTRMSMIMRAAQKEMHKVGLAVVGLAAVLMAIFPFISNSKVPHMESAALIAIVAIDTFALYYFGSANYQLMVADQKGYIKSLVMAGVAILNTVAIWLLVHEGFNVFITKGVSAFVFLITPVGMALYCRLHYRLDPKVKPPKDTLKKRNDAAAHSIANIIHDNTDTIILTVFLDIKFVSVYMVYYAVVGKIKTAIMDTGTGIEAALGEMWAKHEDDNLQKGFRAYEYAMCVFCMVVFSCIAVLIVPFIELYTDQVTDINYLRPDFALLIVAAEAVFCIRQPYRMLVHATGQYKETKNAAILESVINLISSVVFVMLLGLNGVIVGTIIANLYRTISYALHVSRNILSRSFRVVVYRFIWTVAGMLIAIPCAWFACSFIGIAGWTGWIVKGIVASVLTAAVAAVMSLLFYRSDFTGFIGLVMRKLRFKKTSGAA